LNILFRCDGSVNIGMGHIVRSLALADKLNEEYECKIFFAIRSSILAINKVKEKYYVFESDEVNFNYKEWLYECIKKMNISIFIMDMRDGLSRSDLKELKLEANIKVVTIDDPEDKRLEADLAFYPPVPQLKKICWTDYDGELYIGWEYVILRQEFLISPEVKSNTLPEILILMGGTDENNMTEFIINALNQVTQSFKAIIVVGSGYLFLEKLKKKISGMSFQYELYINPPEISNIMSKVDFGIISFGQTAYELAALKVPGFYVCLTNDHMESSKLFSNNKIGFSIGEFFDINELEVVINIDSYLNGELDLYNKSTWPDEIKISDLNKISQIIMREKANV